MGQCQDHQKPPSPISKIESAPCFAWTPNLDFSSEPFFGIDISSKNQWLKNGSRKSFVQFVIKHGYAHRNQLFYLAVDWINLRIYTQTLHSEYLTSY